MSSRSPYVDAYLLAKKALSEKSLNADRIASQVRELLPVKRFPSITSWIQFCLKRLIEDGDRKGAKRIFREVFYEMIREDPSHKPGDYRIHLAHLALFLTGLTDIVDLDQVLHVQKFRTTRYKKATDPIGKMLALFGPIPLYERERLFDIYCHSQRNIPLLIIGETGTSKRLLAEAIHLLGERRREPFETINCTTFADPLFESELFGQKKGSFTGATAERKGIFGVAKGGTVFLDELGKMAHHLQAKLLISIEEQKIRPIGSDKAVDIEVRFIAAAQPKDIIDTEKGILRDLLYRLEYPNYIRMPNLKERFEILGGAIINNSLGVALEKIGTKDKMTLSEEAIGQLLDLNYEGNYRELESILTTGAIAARAKNRNTIELEDLKKVIDQKDFFERKERKDTLLDERKGLDNIKLKDIFEYADKIRASLVEAKVRKSLERYGNLKKALELEGESGYHNFRGKLIRVTGKKLKELS